MKVFRVHAMKEDGFVVVVDKEGRCTRFYDMTEFQVSQVLKAAQAWHDLAPAMSLSQYKKAYKNSYKA
jgi:hypothetical protein